MLGAIYSFYAGYFLSISTLPDIGIQNKKDEPCAQKAQGPGEKPADEQITCILTCPVRDESAQGGVRRNNGMLGKRSFSESR